MLGLRFCARAFSRCGKWGPLFIAVRGPLTIAASRVAEHRLQTRRLSSCGSRAQLLRGMWDLPGPGLKPVSPALAGRLLTTAPPGKPQCALFIAQATLSWASNTVVSLMNISHLGLLALSKARSYVLCYILSLLQTVSCFLFLYWEYHNC